MQEEINLINTNILFDIESIESQFFEKIISLQSNNPDKQILYYLLFFDKFQNTITPKTFLYNFILLILQYFDITNFQINTQNFDETELEILQTHLSTSTFTKQTISTIIHQRLYQLQNLTPTPKEKTFISLTELFILRNLPQNTLLDHQEFLINTLDQNISHPEYFHHELAITLIHQGKLQESFPHITKTYESQNLKSNPNPTILYNNAIHELFNNKNEVTLIVLQKHLTDQILLQKTQIILGYYYLTNNITNRSQQRYSTIYESILTSDPPESQCIQFIQNILYFLNPLSHSTIINPHTYQKLNPSDIINFSKNYLFLTLIPTLKSILELIPLPHDDDNYQPKLTEAILTPLSDPMPSFNYENIGKEKFKKFKKQKFKNIQCDNSLLQQEWHQINSHKNLNDFSKPKSHFAATYYLSKHLQQKSITTKSRQLYKILYNQLSTTTYQDINHQLKLNISSNNLSETINFLQTCIQSYTKQEQKLLQIFFQSYPDPIPAINLTTFLETKSILHQTIYIYTKLYTILKSYTPIFNKTHHSKLLTFLEICIKNAIIPNLSPPESSSSDSEATLPDEQEYCNFNKCNNYIDNICNYDYCDFSYGQKPLTKYMHTPETNLWIDEVC